MLTVKKPCERQVLARLLKKEVSFFSAKNLSHAPFLILTAKTLEKFVNRLNTRGRQQQMEIELTPQGWLNQERGFCFGLGFGVFCLFLFSF